ncbi:MAG: hypothetical protein RBT11_07645 [Desulfobacterales bacterium]|jgi:adenylate cyclase|nr:hypothetical protein [Desulfobacterales bacterium]
MLAGKTIAACELDTICVIGKKEALRVYEILGFTGMLPQGVIQTASLYENGLSVYRHQNWESATKYFRRALAVKPKDGSSQTMLARCLNSKIQPPNKTRDGVYAIKTK